MSAVVAFVCFAVVAAAGVIFSAASPASSLARSFEFTYVTRIPGGKGSRIWIPLPQSDAYQTIDDLRIESPVPYSKHREPEYGDEYVYLEIPGARAAAGPSEVRVGFRATRREHRVALSEKPVARDTRASAAQLQRFLQPDRRVPLQGIIGDLSAQETRGREEPLAKARAIYDYVIATMRYDKSGTGWGNGDAVWACTAKRGNCTDFHSLFIGMMRAAKIPARFEIGFSVPEDEHGGTIAGYHCWAEFYVDSYGWIPVDASEAWRHPEKKNYFFGAHDDDRVQFTVGRDIRLEPPQQGEPLNYFIYPYGEADGKPLALEAKFSFQDRASNGD
ncbi:MAG TPA: transglutaminase domain-containing protein [Candidatus Acidoferrum sp.]|nr:transglutaminase domain-containing protein [Candidatus Acidoferrum sp.]